MKANHPKPPEHCSLINRNSTLSLQPKLRFLAYVSTRTITDLLDRIYLMYPGNDLLLSYGRPQPFNRASYMPFYRHFTWPRICRFTSEPRICHFVFTKKSPKFLFRYRSPFLCQITILLKNYMLKITIYSSFT